jgi:nucleotide-binding universal stress UspA family protein
MIRNILLPVDGSTFSEHGLPVALDIARRAGAQLHIVQVHESMQSHLYPDGLTVYDESWDESLRTQEQEYMQSLALRCQERAGVSPRTEVLEGPTAATLGSYAAEMGIDLIVMTTHGRGGISRAWVGSTADALVRRAAVPILLIRPKDQAVDWDHVAAPRHILIPLDGSPLSESAIEPALALGSLSDARYTLLRVVLPIPFVMAPSAAVPVFDETGARRSQAESELYLERTAERLRRRNVPVDTASVIHTTPALGVLDFAATHGIDAIAMATRGRGGWSRIALGSVADKVMRGSLLPTLLFRPKATPSIDEEATASSADNAEGGSRWSEREP